MAVAQIARHIYFRYNATSGDIVDSINKQFGPENMGIAVGILFLAILCAEILLLPVWAPAISISGITQLPVIFLTTALNSRTSKT